MFKNKQVKKAKSDSQIHNKEAILDTLERRLEQLEESHIACINSLNIMTKKQLNSDSGSDELSTSSSSSQSSSSLQLLNDDFSEIKALPEIPSLFDESKGSDVDLWLNNKLIELRKSDPDIYDTTYYLGLDEICQKTYIFWMEKHKTQKLEFSDYIKWENYIKTKQILNFPWNDQEFRILLGWLFISFNSNELIEQLISKRENSKKIKSEIRCFKFWWEEICTLKEEEFLKLKIINFVNTDFILTKDKIFWGIICITSSIIKRYFQMQIIELKKQNFDDMNISNLKKEWDNLLWTNFGQGIYKSFINENKTSAMENEIETFLNSIFNKLKIITNENQNSEFWAKKLSNPDTAEFINNLFKEKNLEIVKNSFLSFVNKNISSISNFNLKNEDRNKMFNSWIQESIKDEYMKQHKESIFRELSKNFDNKEINNFIDQIEIEISKYLDRNSLVDNKEEIEVIFKNIEEIVKKKIYDAEELNNFICENFATKDKNLINKNQTNLQEFFYKIGKAYGDYTSIEVTKQYEKWIITSKGAKKYNELKKKGITNLIKYANSLDPMFHYESYYANKSEFTLSEAEFYHNIILYFSDREFLKDQLKGQIQNSAKYIDKFTEITNFLIENNINEQTIKNISIRHEGNKTSKTTSYADIPRNNEIRVLVKNYLLNKLVKKLKQEAKKEVILEKISNLNNFLNELKSWVKEYYLPPQIYFEWINNFLYVPISYIYQDLKDNFNSYSYKDIKQCLVEINNLSEEVIKLIYDEFIIKENLYFEILKKAMNIEITVDCVKKSRLTTYADNLTFHYDHLLRNLYLTTNGSNNYLDKLNFRGSHRLDGWNISCCCYIKRPLSKNQPIVKNLEYLELNFVKNESYEKSKHGCKKKRATNKSICESVDILLNAKRKIFKLLKIQKIINNKK